MNGLDHSLSLSLSLSHAAPVVPKVPGGGRFGRRSCHWGRPWWRARLLVTVLERVGGRRDGHTGGHGHCIGWEDTPGELTNSRQANPGLLI